MNYPPHILVVDDEDSLRNLLATLLRSRGYVVQEARHGLEALDQIEGDLPDLILLDLAMPKMNGFEVLKVLKKRPETQLIPVIVLTAYAHEKVRALDLGADDFLAKPFDHAELLARLRAHLRLRSFIHELERAEDILAVLARMVEAKDSYTEAHTERVTAYALELGQSLDLGEEERAALRRGGLLHDIGKIGVPEAILKKPGPLTPEEFEVMKTHTLLGEEICRPLQSLRTALPIIRNHHERWDGKGYPDGLEGEAIPLLARIVAIADAYDAMTSDRPYRPAMSPEKAQKILEEGRGQQWDPQLVDLFLGLRQRRPVLSVEEGRVLIEQTRGTGKDLFFV